MEIRKKISGSALRGIIEVLFFSAMFTLPWINHFRAATFLFIIIGITLVLSGSVFIDYSWYRKQKLFWLFLIYYLFQVIALFIYPHDEYVHADMERKISMMLIPLLLYILVSKYHDIWHIGMLGFTYGNALAALICFITAVIWFIISKDPSVFFYHEYAHIIGLSAIYFSLYLLVALGYIILNFTSFNRPVFIRLVAFFLYLNILLLSSKILIIAGTLLLIVPVLKSVKLLLQKIAVFLIAACICLVIAGTGNPIKERYSDINVHNDSIVLTAGSFKNFPFDGLSLRLLLWRMGNELVNENKMWIWGAGGERYHEAFSNKIKQYCLYGGNIATADTGYQNYNMHDQYMESYLQFGIAGVLLLIGILTCSIYCSIHLGNSFLLFVSLLFLVAFVTESVWETQAGILLFIIITSGEWIRSQRKTSEALI